MLVSQISDSLACTEFDHELSGNLVRIGDLNLQHLNVEAEHSIHKTAVTLVHSSLELYLILYYSSFLVTLNLLFCLSVTNQAGATLYQTS
jgi:hypothetical protein